MKIVRLFTTNIDARRSSSSRGFPMHPSTFHRMAIRPRWTKSSTNSARDARARATPRSMNNSLFETTTNGAAATVVSIAQLERASPRKFLCSIIRAHGLFSFSFVNLCRIVVANAFFSSDLLFSTSVSLTCDHSFLSQNNCFFFYECNTNVCSICSRLVMESLSE